MNNFSAGGPKVSSSPSKTITVSPPKAPVADKKEEKSEIEEDVIEEDENYSEEFD